MEKNIINLEIIEDLVESGVSAISLVDYPAIEKDWLAFKKEKFVEPSSGENEEDFIPRCIAYNINEGKDQDQAAAICYSAWENHSKDFNIEPNPCWEGYEPYGLKDDGSPNCIPIKSTKEELSYDVSSLPSYTEQVPKKKKDQYDLMGIPLPRGEKVILQAEDQDYNRGLIVELLPEGGYNVEYWFNEPSNIVPSEIKVDGELITDAGTTTYLGYHPEMYTEKLSKLFFASEDQQIVVGPAMIPEMEILRKDEEGKPYYVKFSKEVIQRIAEKFMMELRNHDTNIQHDSSDPAHSFVMETWLVENEEDKANSLYKMDVPVGTWMVKMRVLDPATWKMVKDGKLNGFSIEGSFMSQQDYEAYKKDKELYDRIIKILKSV